ncbi:MAG: hypothetical protein AAF388_23815 [Bacteroidota bacterium]
MKVPFTKIVVFFLLILGIRQTSYAQGQLSNVHAEGATQILVDNEENLILLYPEEAVLRKYLAPSYDSVLVFGGASQLQDGMVYPTKAVLFSRQDIYVLDESLQQLILLNKDFSEVGRISLQEEAFNSPNVDLSDGFQAIDFVIGPGGAVYLINQLDAQILKYNSFTGVEWQFGGVNYGEGSLQNPISIGIDDQQLFVYDADLEKMILFDLYGNYVSTLSPEANGEWRYQGKYQGRMFWMNGQQLWVTANQARRTSILSLKEELGPIKAIYPFQNKLYVISKNQVHLQDISAILEE